MSITAISQCSRFADCDAGIDLKAVTISVEGKDLLCDAHVQLNTGVHYGLLGRNGVGKSILLTCLANGQLLSPDLREKLRIMFIQQSLDDSGEQPQTADEDISVLEELNRTPYGADVRFTEKEKWEALAKHRTRTRGKEARERLKTLESAQMVDEAQAVVHEHDTTLDPATVHAVAKSLKITDEMLKRPMRELSGGWKMRVHLAKALLFEPDVLLLDEPTNHLDIAGIAWLQRTIKDKFAHTTIVFVSHNRTFLNEVADQIVWFKNKTLEYFKGNYDQFTETLSETKLYADRMQNAIDRKRAQLEASIQQNLKLAHKQGDDKRLKQVASKKTKMEERFGFERNAKGHRFKLNRDRIGHFLSFRGEVEGVVEESTQTRLRFHMPEPLLPRSIGPLLTAEDVGFKRTDAMKKTTFELSNITFSVELGERIAILGANGEGKTTLLNLLAEACQPTKGVIRRQTNHIGYFRQDSISELGRENRSALERLSAMYPSEKQNDLWSHLGSFGLGSPLIATRTSLGQLSGGQKVAYAFAELSFSAPLVLILDEPNSHLDLDALEALSESLEVFQGAVIFVSHDISFVLDVATSAYWVSKGSVSRIELDKIEETAYKTTRFM